MFLSKTDFIDAHKCIKSLWLKKNSKDLTPEIDDVTQKRFDDGEKVQLLARKLYPNGTMVPAESLDVINGSKLTIKLAKENDVLFEAFACLDNGAFCRIDILKRNENAWDLVEIKSATDIKEEYIIDLAFQKYVFENAGYPVKNCYVIYINNKYIHKGELDIKQLFARQDVTELVEKISPCIPAYVEQFLKVQKR